MRFLFFILVLISFSYASAIEATTGQSDLPLSLLLMRAHYAEDSTETLQSQIGHCEVEATMASRDEARVNNRELSSLKKVK